MGIDLSQFKETFFEESFEGLDLIEDILIKNEPNDIDNELVNSIFRAAHSLKSGSATFSFNLVADLTHVLETYLDEVRNDNAQFDSASIDLILKAVDVIKFMLQEYRANKQPDCDVSEIMQAIQGLQRRGEFAVLSTDTQKIVDEKESEKSYWQIAFIPDRLIFHSGNDPLRYLREIASLGDYQVEVILNELPALEEFDADNCYLSWRIFLSGKITKETISDVFEWVTDQCQLEIKQVDDHERVEETSVAVEAEKKHRKENLQVKKDSENSKAQEISSLRVKVERIDELLNMVGELVITQSMISQIGNNFEIEKISQLLTGISQLEQNTRELQESVMKIRMVPISFAFDRVPRIVYDISKKLQKKVRLEISGESTELDKTVMQQLTEPFVHLVRNSLDHGIETPAERIACGKEEEGVIKLAAFQQGEYILIQISDDGAGLNTEKIKAKAISQGLIKENEPITEDEVLQLILRPGFSTAQQVTDISGRGVGMDVVLQNIKSLGGTLDVSSSKGKGSTFSIKLPLTLAILEGQLVMVNKQVYVIPLMNIMESLQIQTENISSIYGKMDLYKLRDEYIPMVDLRKIYAKKDSLVPDYSQALLVVVESGKKKHGLVVNDLLEQQQIVIKNLEENYNQIEGISGATILGDGTVALIFDLDGLADRAKRRNNHEINQLLHQEHAYKKTDEQRYCS